jgi:hypothetical protein
MNITEQKVKQVTLLLEQIASSALVIDSLCYHTPPDADADADDLYTKISVMRDMVARIGWMADLGLEKLTGQADIKGGAEQWLMSPVYVETLKRSSVDTEKSILKVGEVACV